MLKKDIFLRVPFYTSIGCLVIGFLRHAFYFSDDWSVSYLLYGLSLMLLSFLFALAFTALYLLFAKKEDEKAPMPKYGFYIKEYLFAAILLLLIAQFGFNFGLEDETFSSNLFCSATLISPWFSYVIIKNSRVVLDD